MIVNEQGAQPVEKKRAPRKSRPTVAQLEATRQDVMDAVAFGVPFCALPVAALVQIVLGVA